MSLFIRRLGQTRAHRDRSGLVLLQAEEREASPRGAGGACSLMVYNVKERKVESEVAQSCPTLCYPMDCSLPGSSVLGIFQARILEWIAISSSRGSS